jgi:uncharacterized protein
MEYPMTETRARTFRNPFHLLIKPIGPVCNLACEYCYYLEKTSLYGQGESYRMSDDVLEATIRKTIEAQDAPGVEFGWQGGEPTLLGVDFFRRAVELQHRYAGGKEIHNSIQTNATLLDDEWAAFLAENRFLVGVSIDGPKELHDAYRKDRRGGPSHDLVMRGIRMLQKHGAEFNTLTTVHRVNAPHPVKVYRFLRKIGARYMQFIPIVERIPDERARELGLDLSLPPRTDEEEARRVTEWSVRPGEWGRFLIEIFDVWVRQDVGRVFIQAFDSALANWTQMGPAVCVSSPVCGNALVLEHNGDVFACDHFVYPEYRRGNIATDDLRALVDSEEQQAFGRSKRDALPGQCLRCAVRFACHGGCLKHRFLTTADGEPGLNYLCRGYQAFFEHIRPAMDVMADLLRHNRPASDIMRTIGKKPA